MTNEESFSYSPQFVKKICNCICLFDSRVIAIPYDKSYECVNNLIWRSVYDCHRNAVSTYARHFMGSKNCFEKNSHQMIKMMSDKGID